MTRWISVKEGLPKVSKRVLVRYLYSMDYHTPTTEWISCGHIAYYENDWIVDSQAILTSWIVTHWREIPKFEESNEC